MSIEAFLSTNELGMVALVLTMSVPFALVSTCVAHGWRLKRQVDRDHRQLVLLARNQEARVLSELCNASSVELHTVKHPLDG